MLRRIAGRLQERSLFVRFVGEDVAGIATLDARLSIRRDDVAFTALVDLTNAFFASRFSRRGYRCAVLAVGRIDMSASSGHAQKRLTQIPT
jgi:hypothetical protein